METTQSQREQRRQRRNNGDIHQQTHQVKDFATRRLDFYLHSLEEEIRCELKDSEARLTRGQSEQRLHLDIHVDSLTALIDQLQDKQEDNKSKEQMQSEICRLQALLDAAPAKHDQSDQEDTETLKLRLRKICFMLRTAQSDLEQKTSYTKDLEVKLEAMTKKNEDLQSEVEAMKLQVRVEKQLRAVAETNMETTTHGLKLQLFEKDTAEFEARTKAEQLEADLVFERDQAQKLQAKLNKMEESLAKQKEDAKKTLERVKASHQAQLEEQKAETRKISSALKKAEDLLETQRRSWQQKVKETEKSKTFFAAQLEEQKQENKTLADALQKVELQLETHHNEWQKEKSSLLQATEDLRKTLQEKEQEAKKTIKQDQDSYEAQLEEHRAETIKSALKKAEDLLETQRCSWQQEKTALLEETDKSKAAVVAQLDVQRKENETLEDALKTLQQQLEEHRTEWQEEKSSLLQATEDIRKTLQEKEQEWKKKEFSLNSQLTALESQLAKKKKKKKWYRVLMCGV